MNVIKFGLIFIVLSLLTVVQAADTKTSPSPAQELSETQKQTVAHSEKTHSESADKNEYYIVYVDEDGNEVNYTKDNEEFHCINCDGEGDIEEEKEESYNHDADEHKFVYIDEDGNEIYGNVDEYIYGEADIDVKDHDEEYEGEDIEHEDGNIDQDTKTLTPSKQQFETNTKRPLI